MPPAPSPSELFRYNPSDCSGCDPFDFKSEHVRHRVIDNFAAETASRYSLGEIPPFGVLHPLGQASKNFLPASACRLPSHLKQPMANFAQRSIADRRSRLPSV